MPASAMAVHRVAVLVHAVRMRCRPRGHHTLRAVVVPAVVEMVPRMTGRRAWAADRRRAGITHRRRARVHNRAADRETEMHAGLCPPGCCHQREQAQH